jgi:hypothetical protein
LELLACYQITGPLQQSLKNLEGLVLNLETDAMLPKLPGPGVQFEDAEADWRWLAHSCPPEVIQEYHRTFPSRQERCCGKSN